MNARELALSALVRARWPSAFVQDELRRLMDAADLSPADCGLATEIAQGTVRHRRTLDWLLQRLLAEPIRRMPHAARCVLESAAYQILFLDRVPDYAVVNESVELMRRRGRPRLAGLANAVLRRLPGLLDRAAGPEASRDAQRAIPAPHGGTVVLAEPLLPEEPAQRLGIALSQPDFLARRWLARWGEARARKVCQALNRPPRLFARVNLLRTTPPEVLARLPAEQRDGCHTPGPRVLDLTDAPRATLLALLDEGLITVEDPTAMLPVEAMALAPGLRVLDLCAAPGGKASYAAELMAGQGTVVAADRPGPRFDLLRGTVARLRLENVRVVANDAARPPDELAEPFDRVLVDVPCSNTGVLGRRPDARWRASAESLQSLVRVQGDLLRQAARLTRRGGLCVYSTCSLEPEENEQVVRQMTAEDSEMAIQVEHLTLPAEVGDGGYFARLVRT